MSVDNKVIKVRIADYKIAKTPHVLITLGLGSCVGLSIYDKIEKIGGLAHIMLPRVSGEVAEKFYPRYADTAIKLVLSELHDQGCKEENMVAKIVGGACMFPSLQSNNKSIGDRNVDSVMEILQALNIPVEGSDTGGDYGRSIEFQTLTGGMIIKSVTNGTISI